MISIIVPLYNKSSSINRTIDSILAQTYENFEIVIVDDGSTDNGASKVQKYKDSRIKFHAKKNGGVSSARNYGVTHSSGDYVLFLDADDIILPECLEVLMGIILKYRVSVATANILCNYTGKEKPYSSLHKEGIVANPFKKWVTKKIILRTGNTLMKREVVERFPYQEKLSRYEDLESAINVMRFYRIAYGPTPVMIYTNDYAGLSIDNNCFRKDFASCMPTIANNIWEILLYVSLLKEAIQLYPQYKSYLNKKYMLYSKLIPIYNCLYLIYRIKNKLRLPVHKKTS